ncbi:MAG: diacylglycerol kinase family protein [Deltaproteobacteria bacterium]
MRALCLVNPRARRLRRGRLAAEQVQAILGRVGDVVITKDLAHLEDVLERELGTDVACIVTVGGDGALHWTLNFASAIARARGIELPPLLPARSGTIDFVARKVGLEGSPADILERLAARLRSDELLEARVLPTARFAMEETSGRRRDVIGFAAALGGIGVRFYDQYYAHPDPSPATIVSVIARAVAGFPFGTTHAREMFRPQRAKVRIDGEPVGGSTHSGLHAGAIDLDLGGVLKVFPMATEGRLHLHAGELEPRAIIASLPALARGGLIRGERFVERAGRRFEVDVGEHEPLRPVLDGERYPDMRSVVVTPGPAVRVAVV